MKNVIIDGVEYTPVIKKESLIVNETFNFELHPETKENLTWYEAVDYCNSLGKGWRLPSIIELMLINKYKLIKDGYYWSSTELGNYDAGTFYVFDGTADNGNKNYIYYVRAVRDLNTIKNK